MLLTLFFLLLYFYYSFSLSALYSFPTRRSSDLGHDFSAFLRFVCSGVSAQPGPTPKREPMVGNSAKIPGLPGQGTDRKSTRLNSSHVAISYAVFCLKKKTKLVNTLRTVSRQFVI